TLNPAIEPFYTHLEIPIEARPWPDVGSGCPRRASVNTFGFGGTNAHAIIESYDSECRKLEHTQTQEASLLGPLIISAHSPSSLVSAIELLADHIKVNDSINLEDLSWTLQLRRTVFPFRAAFTGVTKNRLLASMDEQAQRLRDAPPSTTSMRSRWVSSETDRRILGIFTGQGAQWPRMGRELLLASTVFSDVIEHCEHSLASVPDPPSWSLRDEIMADASSSRIYQAEIAQPLCTAVQIALVDLLRCAGISFNMVVGHSSGEIAAAYAAGILSSSDAIRIAYYRGYHTMSSRSPGSMMAVSNISLGDALSFCQTEQFTGRICVAASNSPTSVTLSGDTDAIQEAYEALETKCSVKLLKVDKAYHSHHMHLCVEPYLRSLQACNIQVQPRKDSCVWISTVTGDCIRNLESLQDVYWTDNLVRPVLFSKAIELTMHDMVPFDIALEVGPHPVLNGPVTQTIKSILGTTIPYCGLLRREENDVEAVSGALGYIWTNFGRLAAIDFDGYRNAFKRSHGAPRPALLKNLPSYPWDHEHVYWKESRLSRNTRFRSDQQHELLGRRRPDDYYREMRWRNIIHLGEIPWLQGHTIQGQVVFPGAAYLAMALEASKSLFQNRSIKLIELHDVNIAQAMMLTKDSTGIETIFTLRLQEEKGDTLKAEFVCSSCPETAKTDPELNCSGTISLFFGEPSVQTLPQRRLVSRSMLSIDVDRFYRSLSELGYEYSGLFRGLTAIQRTTNTATTSASWCQADMNPTFIVHPAMIDAAFQSVFASAGSVTAARSPFFPVSVRRMRVSAAPAYAPLYEHVNATIDTHITSIGPASRDSPPSVCADIDISSKECQLEVQVEGLSMEMIRDANPGNDRLLFSQTIWEADISCGIASKDESKEVPSLEDSELPELLERLSHVYLKELSERTPREEIAHFEWYHRRLFEYIDSVLSMISLGEHPIIRKDWESDTRDELLRMIEQFPETVDLQAANAVAESFPAVLKGEITMLEVLTKDGLLTRLYDNALGLPRSYGNLARMAKQITHRYPQLRVLEIGAGTGATTSRILDSIDGAFSSYVYTDISSGFFEKARERFSKYSRRMVFRTFNVENDPLCQGFTAHSFDIVVASGVLHATHALRRTVENVRGLLKPGGYLLLLEPTGRSLRTAYVMGGLPGWWLGGDDGRRLFPGIPALEWDSLLRETGFSGTDILLHDTDNPAKHMYSVILSQAINQNVNMIRQPLLSPELFPQSDQLLIIGGKTTQVSGLIRGFCEILPMWKSRTLVIGDLESLGAVEISLTANVLCLTELDKPVFESMTSTTFLGMQKLFNQTKRILWVTQNCGRRNAHSNMMIGVARVLLNEMPHMDLQMLDINGEQTPAVTATELTTIFLRLVMKDLLDQDVLWSTEPELALEEGALMIPRILPDKELNERLNSLRRPIIKEVSAMTSAVHISRNGGFHCLRQGNPVDTFSSQPAGYVTVRVRYSLLCAIKVVANARLYLCLGSVINTRQRVIAFSKSNSSIIETHADWMCPCGVPEDEEYDHLRTIAAGLVAQNLISSVPRDSILLLHQPREFVADIVAQRALQAGIKVVCTTSHPTTSCNDLWTYIHPLATHREIKKLLPGNIMKFVDWSRRQGGVTPIVACLPSFCIAQEAMEFIGGEATAQMTISASVLQQSLEMAISCSEVGHNAERKSELTDKILAGDLSTVAAENSSFCVVDWTQEGTYSVTINPLEPRYYLSHDKTYLLVGLTGDLGQSLCRWMILNGARNMVLTSRHANIGREWLEEMQSMGANIKVFQMDVSSKQALLSVCSEISSQMPPIAGVVNGAMVLSDSIFADMTFSSLTNVLRPKVDGTINLDELFWDKTLDFFILLSSVSAAAGYRGQSNYAAANMFMAGLATQRRRRGFAASVIDIGMLTEIGYVSRAGPALEEYLRRMNHCLPITEPEFHTMFLEAIQAGRPNSGHQPEIITGLESVPGSISADNRPTWYYNPRFSHFILFEDDMSEQQGGANVVHMGKQLANAANSADAARILQEGFSSRLARILQLSTDNIDEHAPLVHLGVDSLIAIEIRSWFIMEVKVDVPVLKLLSGDTIIELCRFVVARLPTPDLGNAKDVSPMSSIDDNHVTDHTASQDNSTTDLSLHSASLTSRSQSRDYSNENAEDAKGRPGGEGGEDMVLGMKRDGNLQNEIAEATHLRPVSLPVQCSTQDLVQGDDDYAVSAQLYARPRVSTVPDSPGDAACPLSPSPAPLHSDLSPPEAYSNFERTEHMSFAQSRFWFMRTYSGDPTRYNVVLLYDIKGPLDIPRFKKAFQTTVSHHQPFRTCFFTQTETGSGMQGILRESPVVLEHRQISSDADAQEEFDRMGNSVFDLEKGKTFRATLLSQTPSWSMIVFGYHHILMDGLSFSLFLQDLDTAYRMLPLIPRTVQYVDFATDQRLQIERGMLTDDLAFWRDEFSTLPSPLPLLPFSRVRSRCASETYGVHTANSRIPEHLTVKVKQLSRQLHITPFHLHLVAIQTLLFSFIDADDLCIGILDANRTDGKFLDALGLFLNLLPLRLYRGHLAQTFEATAQTIARKVYAALAHSRLPFDVLLEDLNIARSLTHTPLFQVLVNYRMGALRQTSLGDCELRHRAVNEVRYPYDLHFTITEPTQDSCFLSLTVRDDLYTSDACNLLVRSYIHLLDQICHNPQQRLDDSSPFSLSDALLEVHVGRSRQKRFEFPETITRCVEVIAQSSPSDIAVKDGYGNVYTYAQLANRSNAIATNLSAAGVAVGTYVAVLLEPSSDTMAAILAILRLGAIYVPLDVQNPPARLAFMIEDFRPPLILCQANTLKIALSLSGHQTKALNLSSLGRGDCLSTTACSRADIPAVAIYTSGSTGIPKGVLLSQANIMNSTYGLMENNEVHPKEIVLQQSSLGFDVSLYQIFIALAKGGTLVVVPQSIKGHSTEISKLMASENITLTLATPSEYSALLCYGSRYLKKCSRWRLACSAGENMTSQLKHDFRRLGLPGVTLTNWFGPTEACFFSSTDVPYNDSESNSVEEYPSIGRPLPNVSVFIVDDYLRPVPVGFPGEICIAGATVTLGYINDDKLTGEKFVSNPFAFTEDKTNGWVRMYRSGDRGRLLADGSIIFLGRSASDSQIKFRGFRIDLDDVANTILRTAQGVLVDAAVTVRGDPPFLIAFVVFALDSSPSDTIGYLKQLSSKLPLPLYMTPAMMIPLHHLPTTINGKRNRKALDSIPLPAPSESEQQVPLSTTELRLKNLWMESLPDVIDASHVGRDTGFFHVGGSSILLMKLQVLVRESFGVEIPLVDMFLANTLSSMASRIATQCTQEKARADDEEKGSPLSTEFNVADQEKVDYSDSALNPAKILVDWDSETDISAKLPEPLEQVVAPQP
ncbi:uncharacterized protein F4817DRAFT_347767, partial [Daldinia loculata]|uniref:uncharacterized protein n=1 Tax=Daldinia loculata TaxID=103429 RepID=UPI0020C55FEC